MDIATDLGSTKEVVVAAHRARAAGDVATAFRLLKRLAHERPTDLAALSEYGGFCRAVGMLDRARTLFEQMLALDPYNTPALNNLAVLLADCGDPVGADAIFQRALACEPDNASVHTNIVSNAQYIPGITPQALYDLHRAWGERHARAGDAPAPQPRPDESSRPLRIGFLSADFAHHPVAYFMLPLFRGRNREDFSLHCFIEGTRADHMTPEFQALADSWNPIGHLSDADAATLIRERGIDILLDLAGHTFNNRLGVFALRPAPVQISWAGYAGTTGLPAMGYVLADRHQAPPEHAPYYVEKIIRLPHSYVAYAPPDYAPEVGPAPFRANGFVTFGAFHNPAKINSAVLTAWAEILRGVPASRLVLKFRGIEADVTKARITAAMGAAGIDAGRLTFSGASPHPAFLSAYRQIDISLDPFPYSGGVTTCESLWMGVPVVTWRGETFAGRHATGYLTTLGLDSMIADTCEDYIAIAAGLANEPDRLAELRATLRPRFSASPLMDHVGYARDFAAAMRQVWRECCEGSGRSV